MGLPVYAHGLHVERRVGWGDAGRARKVVLVIVVASTLALLSHLGHEPSSHHPGQPDPVPLVNAGAHALSEDPETIRCYSDEEPPLNYSRSITLLLEDANFYNIHQWTGGKFTFDTVTVPELEAPEVRVQLAVTSVDEGCTASLCLVRYENGDQGLGILPPPSGCPAGDPTLLVDVQATVLYAIPESTSKPMRVRRIMSELRAISQYFDALRGDLFISFFYMMSTTGDVRVKDMATDQAFLYTDSGSIEASVSVTGPRSTFFTTTGGRVKADVVLEEGVDMALDFASFGGTMDVELAISDTRASKNLECDVHVLCSTAPMRLNVVSLPSQSPFGVLHTGSRSDFELLLPSTFEGASIGMSPVNINMSTILIPSPSPGAFTFRGSGLTEDQYPKVVARPAPDPEGKGRNRTISSQSYVADPYYVLAGESYWGSRPNTSNHLQWVHSEYTAVQAVLML